MRGQYPGHVITLDQSAAGISSHLFAGFDLTPAAPPGSSEEPRARLVGIFSIESSSGSMGQYSDNTSEEKQAL